jgi:hypothetical protein
MIANYAAIGVILSVSVSRYAPVAGPPDENPKIDPGIFA